MIVGIDEVGRGPWAGPLVFGAVILGGETIEGLDDSKKLSKKRRLDLDKEIRQKAQSFGLGWVSPAELDEVGLSQACELGCRRALEQIGVSYNQIIIDGTVNFLKNTGKGPYVTTIKQADQLIPSVSAASILAKVARDTYMTAQAELLPEYDFAGHVGYGTSRHREALLEFGVSQIHRRSFKPVAALLGEVSHENSKDSLSEKPTTRELGDVSESAAAEYLTERGYEVLERNWKTKVCEIDIVAKKAGAVYFIEVKHRKTDQQGGGLAAITSKKLNQMKFAARVYAHFIGQDETDLRLAVVTTTGGAPEVVDFLEID